MRDFIALFAELDATSRTSVKLDALKHYFDRAPADDGAWAVYMLTGRRMKRLVGARKLRAWVTEACGLPEWLVEETYQHVGDLAETISLLMDPAPEPAPADTSLTAWV
ncbi:MAG TPA: ATP-dependent DNA ligase, partial [Alcanivorax sp.]|nr:ATP-dependent DNA ligase [Alcanivorax sp.]